MWTLGVKSADMSCVGQMQVIVCASSYFSTSIAPPRHPDMFLFVETVSDLAASGWSHDLDVGPASCHTRYRGRARRCTHLEAVETRSRRKSRSGAGVASQGDVSPADGEEQVRRV